MEIIEGRETHEISLREIKDRISSYSRIVADLGCGDGKFVYEMGRKNPESFFIGIDADRNNLVRYSKKITKKKERGGLDNVIYMIANVESLPSDLDDLFDEINVILPWGSLLHGIVNSREVYLKNISRVSKPGAIFLIYINYDVKYEPVEMERAGLPEVTDDLVRDQLIPIYGEQGLIVEDFTFMDNEEVKSIPSNWTRKLAFGRSRKTLRITGVVDKGGGE